MKHRVKSTAKFGRKADHRALLMRNMATSLVQHEKIETTAAKADALQSYVERIIANVINNESDREAIRYLKTEILTEAAQKKIFTELKAKYADRKGGYTRITPVGFRGGDHAPKVQIELV